MPSIQNDERIATQQAMPQKTGAGIKTQTSCIEVRASLKNSSKDFIEQDPVKKTVKVI